MNRRTILIATVLALIALAALLVVTGFHPYGKTSNVQRDWVEAPEVPFLWNQSDVVVRGTVGEVGEARWSTESGERPWSLDPLESHLIYRPVEVNVTETFKGNASGTVHVMAEGGPRDGYTLLFNDMPSFSEGEEVVLFLSWSEPGSYMGTYRVAQPGYRVVTGSNGKHRLRGGFAESSYGEYRAAELLTALREGGVDAPPNFDAASDRGLSETSSVETVAAGLAEHSSQIGLGEEKRFTFRVVNYGNLSGDAEAEVHRVESVKETERVPPSGNISVESNVEGFEVEPGRNASFDLTVKVDPGYAAEREEVTVDGHTQTHVDTDTSIYLVTVRVENETFRDWLRVMAIDGTGHVPGWSGLNLPHV